MQDMARLPYPGLRAYTRDETDLFFGREGCVNEMVDRLAETRFLAVLGTSGSGKSSLVRTGLLDALELGLHASAGTDWTIVEFAPGEQPMRNLARALVESTSGADADDVEIDIMLGELEQNSGSIADLVTAKRVGDGGNLLLLVDQFEELFRYRDYAQREEAEDFVALLLAASQSDAPISVTLTMRSEYLGACALIPGLSEQITRGLYLTQRLTREECRSAIEGPASVLDFEIEPALVTRLLNDLASFAPWDADEEISQLERLSRQADQLPIMQHVLNRLWSRSQHKGREGVALTLADYLELGELRGALEQHGSEILDRLDPPARDAAESFFRGLVSGGSIAGAVRRPTRLDDLIDLTGHKPDDIFAVAEAFRADGTNFIRPGSDTPLSKETVIDIGHESLIRQWRTLSGWYRSELEDGARWRQLADDTQRHARSEADTLSETNLLVAEAWWKRARPSQAWAQRHGGQFTEVRRYLDESREQVTRRAQSEQRNQSRLRFYGRAALAAMAALVVVGFYSFWMQTQANAELAGVNDALQSNNMTLEQREQELLVLTGDLQAQRDRAVLAEKSVSVERDNVEQALETAQTERDRAVAAEEIASSQRDKAVAAERETATERDRARAAEEEMITARNEAEATSEKLGQLVVAFFAYNREQDVDDKLWALPFMTWLQADERHTDVGTEVAEIVGDLHSILITESESMTDDERDYWRNLLEVMNPEQQAKLIDILMRERIKLRQIDAKYGVTPADKRKQQDPSTLDVKTQYLTYKASAELFIELHPPEGASDGADALLPEYLVWLEQNYESFSKTFAETAKDNAAARADGTSRDTVSVAEKLARKLLDTSEAIKGKDRQDLARTLSIMSNRDKAKTVHTLLREKNGLTESDQEKKRQEDIKTLRDILANDTPDAADLWLSERFSDQLSDADQDIQFQLTRNLVKHYEALETAEGTEKAAALLNKAMARAEQTEANWFISRMGTQLGDRLWGAGMRNEALARYEQSATASAQYLRSGRYKQNALNYMSWFLTQASRDPAFEPQFKAALSLIADNFGQIEDNLALDECDFGCASGANSLLWEYATSPESKDIADDILGADIVEKFAIAMAKSVQLGTDVKEMVRPSLERKMSRITFLDTLAVYYCSTGKANDTQLVYDTLILRLDALEAAGNDDYSYYDWRQIHEDLKGCADGRFDPYTQDWDVYQVEPAN